MMQFALPVTVLIMVTLTAAPYLHPAFSQSSSIATSADAHNGTFFGEAVLQVIIEDPNADDDATVEEMVVEIDAEPDSGSQASTSVIVPETSDSSGRFEFYLVHVGATAVDPSDIDPVNSAGVEGDGSCSSDCAPFVTFGPSADIQVDAELYEDVSFDISNGDDEITINYEESFSEVALDRSAYGSDSFVYVFIDDQDANLNPTDADEFVVDPSSAPNSDLISMDGATIEATVTFRETGDNTARFEGRYELGASIDFDSESLVLTVSDKANYADTLDADENDSDRTDQVSFVIGDDDGTVDVGGDPVTWDAELSTDKPNYSFGESILLTIEDLDANANPGNSESIDLVVSTRDGNATITASETGPNTGIFTTSLVIGLDGTLQGTQLEIVEGDSIMVSYLDEKPADYSESLENGLDPEREFRLEVATLASASSPPFVTASQPVVRDVTGLGAPPVAGRQLVLSTTLENDRNAAQPFVSLIEVRDSVGITLYLAWQSGDLEPAGVAPIGFSWIPEASGTYEVRTFVLSSFDEGLLISEISTSSLVVS